MAGRKRRHLRARARAALRAARLEARSRPTPPKLSEEMAALQKRFSAGPLTLGEVVTVLQGRGWMLLLILLAIPFATPVPVPLLSTPFGLAIALISLRLAFGQTPWLPQRLLAKSLPPGFFDLVLRFAGRVLRLLEKFLRPRTAWLAETPGLARIHALAMGVAALVLLLPLPIPFSNAFPAWLILLVAGGLLERDGVAILTGYGVGAGGIAFFYFLGEAAIRLLDTVKGWFAS